VADNKAKHIDTSRRRFLVRATTVVGGAGVAAAAVPFILSMEPSARSQALGAPIDVDLSKLEVAQMITVQWRLRPVLILHRSSSQLKRLSTQDAKLKDPRSDAPQQLPRYKNPYRSLKPPYLVLVGICTHLGCVPFYRPQSEDEDLGRNWEGGFYCACHGSRYDLSGRVMNGSPAPLNLPVPPYYYLSDTVVRIGELKDGSEIHWMPAIW
jgi:ubiquinol-cytochrome c reductase iron-sulfur subunit